jgi:hypothetical protein
MKVTNSSKKGRRGSDKRKYEKYSNYISPPYIDKRNQVI